MILETVRAVADWLEDATYGVAARLASLTYDGTDAAPSGTWTVTDETRDNDAAIDRPTAGHVLKVVAGEVRSLAGEAATYLHTAQVPLEITVQRTATSPAALVRDLYYTQRAVLACVESLFDPSIAAAVTACSRNGVQLQVITALSVARVAPALDDNLGTGAVYVTVQVRDTLA
jgi:hypothetical protein